MLHFLDSLKQSVRRTRHSVAGVRRRRSLPASDGLESRTLLASLVSATKLTYQDADGDSVTVTLSRPVLTAGNVNSIFTFNTGTVDGSNATKQQLRSINLVGVAGSTGTTITTVAVRSATNGGDGFAALGEINATGIDIGAVTIDGDLGRILAGDATTSTQGLGALKVHSIGRYGTLSGAMNLESVIQGKLASLTTKADIQGAFIDVQGGANGDIGSLTIGGSLIGGAVDNSGQIRASSDIGAVKVTGNVVGGSALFTGVISADDKLASITIEGALVGGSGLWSGLVQATDELGAVNITGDVIGGTGNASGAVFTNGKLPSVTIGGSLIGAAGLGSGVVYSLQDMGAVTVKGNLVGGSAAGNTVFHATGAIITMGKLASATVGGSILGGTGVYGGAVISQRDMGTVKVTGDVVGGQGIACGLVSTDDKLANLTIGGSLLGGSKYMSGIVVALDELTTVLIKGDIRGGSASGTDDLNNSGTVFSGRIGSMTLSGSLIAGTDNTSGQFHNNGTILAGNDIANLKISGSVLGNSTNPAQIFARGQLSPSGTTDLAIGKLTIDGRVEQGLIFAGKPFSSATTNWNADAQIGPVIVGGDWIASSLVAGAAPGVNGQFGDADDTKLSGGSVKDVANVFSKITSIVIGGQVIGTPTLLTDHYGFVAENIGSFKAKGGSTSYTLTSGNSNDEILLSLAFAGLIGRDVRLNEI